MERRVAHFVQLGAGSLLVGQEAIEVRKAFLERRRLDHPQSSGGPGIACVPTGRLERL